MKPPTHLIALAAFFFAATANNATAHDLWLEPRTFTPAVGTTVSLHLRVGDRPGEAVPVGRDPAKIVRFVAAALPATSPDPEPVPGLEPAPQPLPAPEWLPVPGIDGQDPAGLLATPAAGLVVVAYQGRPRPHELAAAKFEAYLGEEGLEAISARRSANGDSARPGRELYSRHVKALLAVGGAAAARAGSDQPLGLPFELVARTNPYAGGPVTVEARYRSQPVAGVLIDAKTLAEPVEHLAARTDARGRATFELPHGGPWGLFAVHMVPATEAMADATGGQTGGRTGGQIAGQAGGPLGDQAGGQTGADWVSFWAALTFALAPGS